jgi:hypothetical protein
MGTGVTLAVRPPGNLNAETRKTKREIRKCSSERRISDPNFDEQLKEASDFKPQIPLESSMLRKSWLSPRRVSRGAGTKKEQVLRHCVPQDAHPGRMVTLGKFYGQAERPISTGQLHALLRFHLPPIKVVVFDWPSYAAVAALGDLILG